ncbi:MAG TPA: hypothetical protein VGB44_09845 [Flavobacterium sp.]|jgi:hypothetical protein
MNFSKSHRIGIFVVWLISIIVWTYAMTDRFTHSILEMEVQNQIFGFFITAIFMVAMLLQKTKPEN